MMVAEGGKRGHESLVEIDGQGAWLEGEASQKGWMQKAYGEGWESGTKAFLSKFIQ